MMTTAVRKKKLRNPVAVETPRILCVDDDPELHTSLELRMRDYDVQIERAFYGMQGIVEASHTMPDLILMDHAMPNGDGDYLLQCIKGNRATASIPIIVLTGMRDPLLRNRLLSGGADVFLNKPISFDQLVHEMSRFIDMRRRDQ